MGIPNLLFGHGSFQIGFLIKSLLLAVPALLEGVSTIEKGYS